jgi:multiple sugar transport system substrate-binding protein/raffinose/stachyose/melibiose transport system substrate-binding protein
MVVLVGCGTANHSTVEPSNVKKKVTLLHYFSGALNGGVQAMVETFNQNNGKYQLVATPLDHEAYKTSIRDTLASPNSPDIYSYWAGARTKSVLGHLESFDTIWQTAGLTGDASKAVTEACTYDGKKYMIPVTQHYVGFFYNKKVFAAAGVQPPSTWSEFLSVCERLKAKGVTPIALGAKEKWPAQFWFDYLLLHTAGYDYRQQLMEGKISYADAPVRKVFDLWASLIDKGYFNDRPIESSWDSGANEAVYKGEAAMTLMGTWIIGSFSDARHTWRQGEEYDYFPFPVLDEKLPRYALGPIDGLVLSKQAVQKEGAKEVLAYLASLESLKAMSRGSGAFVPRRVEPEFYSPLQRRMLKDIDAASRWVFNYDLSTPPKVAAVGLNLFAEFLDFPQQRELIITRSAEKIDKVWKEPGGL